MHIEQLDLQAPTVDEAPEGILDPETIPATGATVRIKPYEGMAFRDHVYLFVGDQYTDDLPISTNGVGQDVTFIVEAQEFIAGTDNILPIRYEVQFYEGSRDESLILDLKLQASFEVAATMDLTTSDHVVSIDKPPLHFPPAARMNREARWGTAPYTYASSDPTIASVDETSGEVTALRNGGCTISATDSQSQIVGYPLTVKGIREVHFLSHSADWQGMTTLCAAAKLQPPTLAQIKRFWTLYFPDTGPVADYLDWLNYAIWTGDALGAGTAWTYDLNGASVNENASSQSIDTFLQVLGVSQL